MSISYLGGQVDGKGSQALTHHPVSPGWPVAAQATLELFGPIAQSFSSALQQPCSHLGKE